MKIEDLIQQLMPEMQPEWFNTLNKDCQEHNLEVLVNKGKIIIVSPKTPAQGVQDKITKVIPADVTCEFVEGPKQSTLQVLQTLLGRSGATNVTNSNAKHGMDLNITGSSPELDEPFSPTWTAILEALNNDAYFDKWDLKLNGNSLHVFDRKMAEELRKNNKRPICIQKDDILNLKISLGSIQTVEEFINSL